MRKNNFKLICIPLLLLIVLCTAFFAGCGDDSVSDIVVKSTDMPRAKYVQGQELDISNGVLTVISGGKESTVPMTAEGVSVSGYNKDTIGKQTITVTYMDKTTTFEVEVVARLAVEGYKKQYFVGDLFDNKQGSIKITDDDGKTTSIKLDNEAVTVKSFSTQTAGDVTVTVTYQGEDISFTVKVYEIADVTFTAPSKTIYYSHDTALDVSGGYFTAKSADGSYSASGIAITQDMISGFDPSAATPVHVDKNPLKQTVTFKYAGKTYTFDIYVYYSSVSIVIDAAKELEGVEVTGKDMELDDNMGAIALNGAKEYFKLTKQKKALIPTEDVERVMKIASVYSMRELMKAAEEFSETFSIDEKNGDLLIGAKSYESTKKDMTNLKDKNKPFNVCATLINNIKDEFEELVLYTEIDDLGIEKSVIVSEFLKAPSQEQIDFYVTLCDYMLDIFDTLTSIPTDWTIEDLKAHSNDIEAAFGYITDAPYYGVTFNGVYSSISSWREKDDYFEIIYTYYLHVYEDVEEFRTRLNTDKGIKLHMPGQLQDWYTYISYAYNELNTMKTNQNAALYDTTTFMYYYEKAVELSNSIMNSEDQLQKDIYTFLGGDWMLYSYLQHPDNLGYYYHSMMGIGSKNYDNLRKAYMDLVNVYYSGKLDLEDNKEMFKNLVTELSKLTPVEVYGFICSVNFYYSNLLQEEIYVLDYSEGARSIFAYFIGVYEYNVLNGGIMEEGTLRPLLQLLKAIEVSALNGIKTDDDDFRAEMEELIAIYGQLSEYQKTEFDYVAGDCYSKYLALYNFDMKEPADLGDVADEYNQLKDTLEDYFEVYSHIYGEDSDLSEQEKNGKYLLLLALSEKALKLYSDILENASDEVLKALSTVKYDFGGEERTLDIAVGLVHIDFFNTILFHKINMEGNSISFWVFYNTSNIRTFMYDVADMLMSLHRGEEPVREDVVAIMQYLRSLEDYDQSVYAMLISSATIYYEMLLNTFVDEETDAQFAFVKAVLETERAYYYYLSGAAADTFYGRVEAAMAEYAKLSAENVDPELDALYNYYLAKYNEIKNSDTEGDGGIDLEI